MAVRKQEAGQQRSPDAFVVREAGFDPVLADRA